MKGIYLISLHNPNAINMDMDDMILAVFKHLKKEMRTIATYNETHIDKAYQDVLHIIHMKNNTFYMDLMEQMTPLSLDENILTQ